MIERVNYNSNSSYLRGYFYLTEDAAKILNLKSGVRYDSMDIPFQKSIKLELARAGDPYTPNLYGTAPTLSKKEIKRIAKEVIRTCPDDPLKRGSNKMRPKVNNQKWGQWLQKMAQRRADKMGAKLLGVSLNCFEIEIKESFRNPQGCRCSRTIKKLVAY